MAQLFSLGHMTTPLPFRVRRFIAVAFCAQLAVFGIYFIPLLLIDVDSQTTLAGIWFIASMVALWPLFVSGVFIFHEDPPPIVGILLWIISGLFWAFLVEVLFIVKARMWPNKPPEPTAVTPSVPHSRAAVSGRRWLSFFR